MRRLRILPLLLVLGLGAACSTFGDAPALTINGREVSTETVDGEMSTILGNEAYSTALERLYQFTPSAGAVKGSFDSAFAAQILTLRVWFDVFERDLKAHGDEGLIDDVKGDLEASIPDQVDAGLGAGAFASFPKSFQRELIHQQAVVEAMKQSVSNEVGNDAEAYYDAHPDEFAEICVSHVLVGTQSGRTAAEATAAAEKLRARIEDGEAFATVAKNESDDAASAVDGGALGCGSRGSLQLVPEFEEAAFGLKVGEVSQPVSSQFGSHLILVTKRTIPDFDQIADIDAEMTDISGRIFNDRLTGALCDANVDVNPRYGRWSRDVCDATTRSTLPRVEPPEGPISDEPSVESGP